MKLNNTYYILRHGEAFSNVKNVNSSWPETIRNPLTKNGIQQVKKSIEKLKDKQIDLIFASDLLRTKQTAELVSKAVKVKPRIDKRLREIDFGPLNNQHIKELLFTSFAKKLKEQMSAETYQDVLKRMKQFFIEINNKYKGKNILLVSHQCPLWVLESVVKGLTLKEALKIKKRNRIQRGELRELTNV